MRHENLVIRGGRVENDVWQALGVEPGEDLSTLPAGPIIFPFKLAAERIDELLQRKDPLGLWFAPDDDPADLAPRASRLVPRLSLIAVHFPKWGDGRGYSIGALLRTRFGWHGELRAFGEIGRDHLFYLARCGFDAFALAPHRDPHAALAGLSDFSLAYQGAVDDPVPLFRKRSTLAAGGSR
ncbi:MAG TPA: DUF934 domain-containing protein [Usitatibacter sp.]|nr:DUF934 domain-containing protein [Usitatibacter sp.]